MNTKQSKRTDDSVCSCDRRDCMIKHQRVVTLCTKCSNIVQISISGHMFCVVVLLYYCTTVHMARLALEFDQNCAM